jgi:glycosyltransferase involved in cell wall biosynthesis
VTIGDYSYLRRLAAERSQNSKLVAAEKDFQDAIDGFHHVESQLREQLDTLSQALAERAAEVAKLRQELAEHEAEVAKLRQELAEHEAHLVNLKQLLFERDRQIGAAQPLIAWLRGSLYWKLRTRLQLARYGGVVKRSGLFDRDYYISQNPDVAQAGLDPVKHYFIRGAYEGRNPHRLFDTSYYLTRNPDVSKAGVNPFAHYLVRGAFERRDPHPSFDTAYYLSQKPEVAKLKLNPLVHYIRYGAAEGRNPHPSFNVAQYLRESPDVSRSFINPQLHSLPSQSERGELKTRVSSARNMTSLAEGKLRMLAASRNLSDALVGTSALVSVIIPCFNYGKYILDALISVLSQTYPHIEVLIIDDGSTDRETLEVLNGIRHERVRVIHQSNQGLAQSRNNGVAVAGGEYLLFLDADDRLERHCVAVLLYTLLRNPSGAYAYPDQRFFGDQELIWKPQAFNAYDLLWSNHPSVCSLVRRRVFDECGYRSDLLYGYEDWEFWVRLSSAGHYGINVPAPVFEHRRHGVTMTHAAHEHQSFLHSQILNINAQWYRPESITATKRMWRPLISIIIPFYNAARYLTETLASLKQQTTQDFEIILVNDGSDDPESLRLLDRLRTSDIQVIDCPRGGPAAARNAGASLARAELIMFLDSDDLLDRGALEKLCWFIALQPNLAFVYSGVVHFGDIEAIVYDEFDGARLHKENFLTVNCVMRRDIYLELGGMDTSLTENHEDYDFWLRLVERGYAGRLFREPLFLYRRRSAGRSAQLVKAVGVGAERLAQSVVTRHVADRERNGLPRLVSRAPQPRASETDPILEEVQLAMDATTPNTLPRGQYRRPNLPNIFCPQRWNAEKTSILYFVPSFGVGGAEAFDLRIMSCLPKEYYSVIVVGCELSEGQWYEEFKASADEIYSLEKMAPDQTGRKAFLRYLMIAKCVDIVFNRNTYYGYELVEQWPLVSRQVRFVDMLHLHAFGKDWVRESAPYHEKIDLRYVTSEDLPEYAAKEYHLRPDRFRLLDYGFEPQELPDEATCIARRNVIREKWKLPSDAFVVGFIGRLSDQKDPIRWLSIAAEIAQRRPGAIFLVIGSGELMDQAKKAAESLGLARDVVFTDYQRDAVDYCAAMDVMMLTSKYEGLPLVVLHALVQGTPVISSDVGGLSWWLTGHAGRVLPLNAANSAYAEAVLEIGRNRASAPSSTADCRERTRKRFAKDRMRLQLQHDFTSLTASLERAKRREDYQLDLMSRPILG